MEKSCGAVLYTIENGTPYYVLVFGSVYGFPKGHVERGETERETAMREIREETGIGARLISGFRREIEYASPIRSRGRKRVVLFLAEYSGVEPHASHEIKAIAVKPFDEALGLLKHRNLKTVLSEANEFIIKNRIKREEAT